MGEPAFKEWASIVNRLGSGEQIAILRKGGIAEGPEGFQPDQKRFWLFPTGFHQHAAKLKPGTPHPIQSNPAIVPIEFRADLIEQHWIDRWETLERLDPFHAWLPAVVRERFEAGPRLGLHLLVVRVLRLPKPVQVPLGPEHGGCRSWVEIEGPFQYEELRPVLDEPRWTDALELLKTALGSRLA